MISLEFKFQLKHFYRNHLIMPPILSALRIMTSSDTCWMLPNCFPHPHQWEEIGERQRWNHRFESIKKQFGEQTRERSKNTFPQIIHEIDNALPVLRVIFLTGHGITWRTSKLYTRSGQGEPDIFSRNCISISINIILFILVLSIYPIRFFYENQLFIFYFLLPIMQP